jgi:hypothetical protein
MFNERKKDLADTVLAAMKAPGTAVSLDIAGAADRPFLPRDKPPPREVFEKIRGEALARTNQLRVAWSDYWLKRHHTGKGFARGDACTRPANRAWMAGEDHGRAGPAENGDLGSCQESRSCLPTEAMLPEGGYGVLDSKEMRAATRRHTRQGLRQRCGRVGEAIGVYQGLLPARPRRRSVSACRERRDEGRGVGRRDGAEARR